MSMITNGNKGMTVIDVLRHQWLQKIRSPAWRQSLIGGLLLVLSALYFGVLFVSVGWLYPEVVAKVAPQKDPLRLLNRGLLYSILMLLVLRFFLQRFSESSMRAYQILPIRRSKLVSLTQITSALSLFNTLPIIAIGALWVSTVLPRASLIGATFWATGGVMLVVLTQCLNTLLRIGWARRPTLVICGAAAVGVSIAVGPPLGLNGIESVSTWLFSGLTEGHLPVLFLLAVGTGSVVFGAHEALRVYLRDTLEGKSTGVVEKKTFLGYRWAESNVLSLLLLDVRLTIRNRRPRQTLLLAFALIGFFALNLVVMLEGATEPTNMIDQISRVVVSYLLSCFLVLQYGGFGYSWHGRHFDRLLLQIRAPHTLVQAQTITLSVLCLASLALVLPIAVAFAPPLVSMLLCFGVYNIGVLVPILIGLGAWQREAIQLCQDAFFNYQGVSSSPDTFALTVVVTLVCIALPAGLVFWLGEGRGILVVAGLGLLGVATVPVWTRVLGGLLWRQRYAMAAGFRKTDD